MPHLNNNNQKKFLIATSVRPFGYFGYASKKTSSKIKSGQDPTGKLSVNLGELIGAIIRNPSVQRHLNGGLEFWANVPEALPDHPFVGMEGSGHAVTVQIAAGWMAVRGTVALRNAFHSWHADNSANEWRRRASSQRTVPRTPRTQKTPKDPIGPKKGPSGGKDSFPPSDFGPGASS